MGFKFETVKESQKKRRGGVDRVSSYGKKAGRSIWTGLVVVFAVFVTGMADHYLGIYAWVMGGVAVMDRFLGVTVTKDFYMTLGLLALSGLIIMKLSKTAGREKERFDGRQRRKAWEKRNR